MRAVKVIPLFRRANRETTILLRALVDMAEKGEISGVVLCYRTPSGSEHPLMSGVYERNLSMGVSAGMKLSWHMTQAEDERRGSP